MPTAPPPLAQYLARFASADAVATECRVRGIRGQQSNCFDCPFARLMKADGFSEVDVQTVEVTTADECEPLPVPVDVFVERFDAGLYLDLVEATDAA